MGFEPHQLVNWCKVLGLLRHWFLHFTDEQRPREVQRLLEWFQSGLNGEKQQEV